MDIVKIKISKRNIEQFYIYDERQGTPEFKADCKELENKILDFVGPKKSTLTKRYPERYDLTVFTYTQNKPLYLINDGCHRIVALRRLLAENKINHFSAWLIPSNIIGAKTKEGALALNTKVKALLDEVGLPHWVQKFDYEEKDGKLIAWKNINLIDTGNKDQRKQYGVNWFLNDDFRGGVDVDQHNYKNKYKL